MIKKIGVFTSGGDCPGLNAAIRAITLAATQKYGWEVIGIRNGSTGFIKEPLQYIKLDENVCSNSLLVQGGTFLGTTTRDNPFFFRTAEGENIDCSQVFFENYKKHELDAVIAIGGDGSMRIAKHFIDRYDINMVGIPKTIDNDILCTETAIGFSTAVEIATEALDRLQPTAASHQRVMVLEVMGRDAGHIALEAGIAGGADVILVPEIPYKLDSICNKIKEVNEKGRNFSLIIVAEGVKRENGESLKVIDSQTGRLRYAGIGQYLCEKIGQKVQAEVRATVLGHVQRGSRPNSADRLLASTFATAAVDLVAEKKFSRMMAIQNEVIIDVPMHEVIVGQRLVDPYSSVMKTARSLGICFGDS